jgi:outer membrane protein OmpA-like peptidoglycan-associated protein
MFPPPLALPRRPRPVAFALSLLVAWLLVALIALGLRRGPIEADLAERATAVVREHAGPSAAVTFEGRDGVLHGTFPGEAAAEQARSLVAAVDGAASARLGADVRIASVPARPLVVAVEREALRVVATVPDRRLRDELLGAAVTASDGALTSDVVVDADVAAPAVDAFAGVAGALAATPGDHTVAIDGDAVVLSGAVPDAAAVGVLGERVLAAARAAVPGAILDNRLAVGGSPAPAPAPAGAGADRAGGWAERLAAATDGETITFPAGGVSLSAGDEALLGRVARVLAAGELTVLVAGHSDGTGPLAFNQVLSADRARAVVAYLAGRGVARDRLQAAGFGPDEPVGPDDTREGRAANRRVEIIPLPR